jgi:putative transposase
MTAQLVTDALVMAIWRRGKPDALLHHSDRGTESTARKTYRTREEATADVFDYIERFYNAKRRHSTIGYMSPMEFERQAGFA